MKPHPGRGEKCTEMCCKGWRGAGGGGGGGINECGLGKRTASHRTDVFVFLTAPQPWLTDAGEVTGKKCADWSDEGGREAGRERGGWDDCLIKCSFRGEFQGYFCSAPSG